MLKIRQNFTFIRAGIKICRDKREGLFSVVHCFVIQKYSVFLALIAIDFFLMALIASHLW